MVVLIASLVSSPCFAQQRTARAYGVVHSTRGTPISQATIFVVGTSLNTNANDNGEFELRVPSGREVKVVASMLGYTRDTVLYNFSSGERKQLTFTLEEQAGEIDAVEVVSNERRRGVVEFVDVKNISSVSGASGNFENIIKILPGVQSSNELSSQYSVRGGSYDENLVYVNGVEIYRPMLTKTGQQEGLSFINPNMVSSVEFSTGGFSAEYGDKMSSVLNVQYKRPTTLGGAAEVSLMGASASADFATPNQMLSGTVGFRYKRTTYLLSSLDTKGNYDPTFSDVQANFTFEPIKNLTFNLLGSYASNKYNFAPTDRNTSFGTINNAMNFRMFYEGQERDKYESLLGALAVKYKLNENVNLGLSFSATGLIEEEKYDILAQYLISQSSGGSLIETDNNVNVGSLQEHARNYTNTNIYNLSHNGSWRHGDGLLSWGLRAQYYEVIDTENTWHIIDSAGYIISSLNTGDSLYVTEGVFSDSRVHNQRYSGYIQETYYFELANDHQIRITPGIRFNYTSLSKEFLVSPRIQVAWYPNKNKNLQIFAAVGSYNQPAFFKEMKNAEGVLNTSLKAQKSWHFVLGGSTIFQFKEIPCKFTTEAYYKRLSDLVPYTQENISLSYVGENMAKGYVWGVDFKLNAELIKGTESWVSASIMQAKQDVIGDSYVKNGEVIYPGYFPMANDQRFNLSILIQDQIYKYPQWRAHLVVNYGTSLPTFIPNSNRYDTYFRMPAYKRVDLGLSYVVFDKVAKVNTNRSLSFLESFIVSIEALNLFDMVNTSSYLWVNAVSANTQEKLMVAVPNYLTPFRLNLKLSITF